jgi:RNA polymerase sigma-70 factor (ECF subfamily)
MHNRVSTSTSIIPGKPAAAAHRDASDDVLIAKVAQGNRLAMQLLFVRHYARVYRFLLRTLGSLDAAEDISTEAFLALWQQAGRFRRGSSVSAWLLGIARSKALREIPAGGRGKSAQAEERKAEQPAEGPEFAHTSKRRREIVRNCLCRLSREHREIVDLVYYHHKSIREVAQILGIPKHSVKARMLHASQKLSQLIQAGRFKRAGL